MPRLFTVEIIRCVDMDASDGFVYRTAYEADFAGIHFSRSRESDVRQWVRVAAKRVYGKDTQVIFIHREGQTNA